MHKIPERALIVGLGGLGCPASLVLARGGVKSLTLIDPDVVELSNLHRQPWHREDDLGRPKVLSAAQKLARAFPHLHLEAQHTRVDEGNVESLFRAHDVVIDASDGVATKFLLSDAAVHTASVLIYAGVLRLEGLAMRVSPGGPCLRCLFESPPEEGLSCAQAGVLGSMAGLVGAMQGALALESFEQDDEATLHVFDGCQLRFRRRQIRRRSDCSVCSAPVKSAMSAREPL